MKVTIQPSSISGQIVAPASKSCMQRACAAAFIRKGKSIIHNYGISNDDKVALSIIQKLGATVNEIDANKLEIDSSEIVEKWEIKNINGGESGLSIRMFTPIAALSKQQIWIEGTGSLVTRPMDFFDDLFPKLGVKIQSNEGKLPLIIKGPLQPKNIEVDGSLSSQFLTGLLMAYSALNAEATITVNNLKSKPYIDLTLEVMKQFGLSIPSNNNYEIFSFNKKAVEQLNKQTINYTVEGDWSGAAFLLVAAAIAATKGVVVKSLDVFSTQGDKKILEALTDSGCILSINTHYIEIAHPPLGLKAFHFNATDCPDLFPPLVALATYCKGKSVIEGVTRLKHKESDRAVILQQEFAKMGVTIELQDDLMIINGVEKVKEAIVHSHDDHRIAMACAIAALKAENKITIQKADAVNKSYPNFFSHLQTLDVNMQFE